jgi:hypothetical protein
VAACRSGGARSPTRLTWPRRGSGAVYLRRPLTVADGR